MTQPNDHEQSQQWPPPGGPPGYYGSPAVPAQAYPQGGPGVPGAPYPGAPYPGAPYPGGFPGAQSYKEPTVAWVLWVFLGFAGGHHFYLGDTKRGVAYLVGLVLSILTAVIIIGLLGYIALFVLWIIDATQMSARIQQCNARIFAANRAAGLA
jgi:TM2 domain-containing membrane protein YozV